MPNFYKGITIAVIGTVLASIIVAFPTNVKSVNAWDKQDNSQCIPIQNGRSRPVTIDGFTFLPPTKPAKDYVIYTDQETKANSDDNPNLNDVNCETSTEDKKNQIVTSIQRI